MLLHPIMENSYAPYTEYLKEKKPNTLQAPLYLTHLNKKPSQNHLRRHINVVLMEMITFISTKSIQSIKKKNYSFYFMVFMALAPINLHKIIFYS